MHLARSAALTGFDAICREVGVDPIQLALAADVPLAALSDPDIPILSRSVGLMYQWAADQSGVEDFALRVAERRKFSNLGLFGMLIREQASLREALAVWSRYLWLQNESLSMNLDESGGSAILRLGIDGGAGRQGVELVLALSVRAIAAIVGPGFKPLTLCLPHRSPASAATLETYRRVLGSVPQFNQDFNGLVFNASDLDAPLPAGDPEIARQLLRQVDQLKTGPDRSFSEKIGRLIAMMLSTNDCTIDHLARLLRIDRRTIHRRLAQEDTSFSRLMDKARAGLATSMLTNTTQPLQVIAEAAGFSSLSAFSRWFRRSHACSATEYRQTQTAPRQAMTRL